MAFSSGSNSRIQQASTAVQPSWAHGLYREGACISTAYILSAFGDETFIPRLPTSRGWGSSEPMVARVELDTSGTRTISAALDSRCPRLRYSQLIPTAAADRRWSFLRKTHRHEFWLCRHWYRQRESNPHLTHLIAHDLPSVSVRCMVRDNSYYLNLHRHV